MTTFEDIASIETADDEPEPLSLELVRLCATVKQLEQLHSEYFGCNPGVPSLFKVGKKALNALTNSVELAYRAADDVKSDIIARFLELREDYLLIEPDIDRDRLCATDFARLEFIEDELHNSGYKRFGLL